MDKSKLIQLLDFTRLTDNDTPEAVTDFLTKAVTPLGAVAAVCVYPEFVALAKKMLHGTGIKIATVANFPTGNESLDVVSASIKQSLLDGADEIDVVMPYQHLIKGDHNYVIHYLTQCRALTKHHVLKVIIESGELNHEQLIAATSIVVDIGADFVKTSTGKVSVGATIDACAAILSVLSLCHNTPGIKLSGGINTPEQARIYLACIESYMGADWVDAHHVRFGASRLLDALL